MCPTSVIESSLLSGLSLQEHSFEGRLISIDGIDGSGKTTTLRLLKRYLENRGERVKIFKLPSNEIKALPQFSSYKEDPLGANGVGTVDMYSLFLIVVGDRLSTLRSTLVPLLKSGHFVLVDRYLYSAICELMVSGVDRTQVTTLSEVIGQFYRPDLSIVTSVDAISSEERIRSRPEERDSVINHEVIDRRIDAFEQLCTQFDGYSLNTRVGISQSMSNLFLHLEDRGVVLDNSSDFGTEMESLNRRSNFEVAIP